MVEVSFFEGIDYNFYFWYVIAKAFSWLEMLLYSRKGNNSGENSVFDAHRKEFKYTQLKSHR